ncbi:winged helix-turn-helix transcriptional regulator [Teichococcus deserti]|uniref:winged helix-turn-helix transcriptional regulator n=1 Tax=Teichococcus deserti TaxID=1817963 RepID=UPI001F610304|nr:helix-turn-helix domain-containing protein [Pseudoroseomonas deserti]
MTKYSPGNHLAPAAAALQTSLDGCPGRGAPKPEPAPRPAALRGCPIRETLEHLGSKWTVLVVIALSRQTRRFSELRRDIPDISQRMLTQTLRDLERVGLVERELHAAVPPRVDYRLSPMGMSLLPPLLGIIDWATQNGGAMHGARQRYDAAAEAG